MGETKPLNSTSFSVYFSFLFFFSGEGLKEAAPSGALDKNARRRREE